MDRSRLITAAVIGVLVGPTFMVAAGPAPLSAGVLPVEAPADDGPIIDDPVNDETSGSIRPGARVEPADGSGWCTLNFVVTDGEDYFIGTAGHCFSEGTDVQVRDETIGTVEFREFGGIGGADWGFVRVEEEDEPDVNPTVRHWGGPNKVPVSAAGDGARLVQPHPGDPLFYYGHGRGMSPNARTGATLLWLGCSFRFQGEVAPGDSGSPVLNSKGQAIGIVTAITPSGKVGSTFQCALNAFESDLGKDLRLVPGEAFLVSQANPRCVVECTSETPSPRAPGSGSEAVPGPVDPLS